MVRVWNTARDCEVYELEGREVGRDEGYEDDSTGGVAPPPYH